MYLETWKEFETASYNLLLQDPAKVRCCMKYCHKESTVHLKVTDNIKCLQFKTSDVQNMKRIELFYDISRLDPVKYIITLLSIEEFPLIVLHKLSGLFVIDRKTLFIELLHKQFAELCQNFSIYRETNDVTEYLTLGDCEEENYQSYKITRV